ncbi:MAG TPA: ABC transporter permease subunit [bacterium]|nr:ABC transporter permease subunit [bacterium]
MRVYIAKRLLAMIPTILGITVITFLIIQLAPGNPAEFKVRMSSAGNLDPQYTAQIIEQTKKLYGLDKPLPVRYWIWVKQVVTFNFGESYKDHRPVREKIIERVPVSLQLSIISIFMVYLFAVPIGVFSAVKQKSFSDRILTVILFILYSLPNFWVAMMLITFLGGGEFLDLFPIFGLSSDGADKMAALPWLIDRIHHLALPVFCLTYEGLAYISRQMRGAMLEQIRLDYVRTARAKGLAEKVVVFKHAFRNSLIPIVTLLAMLFPAILGGSVIIESIFSIPGMGQLSFESILARDYPTIMGITTVAALLTLVGILIADLTYTLVDPRITFESAPLTFNPRRFLIFFAIIALVIAGALAMPQLEAGLGTELIKYGPDAAIAILAMTVLYGLYTMAGEKAYWWSVAKQFGRDHVAVAALAGVGILFIVAAASPLIANSKPLAMRYQGGLYFPAFRDYLPERMRAYRELKGRAAELAQNLGASDWAVMPPVPWDPYQYDLGHFLERPTARHLLGTDDTGRDVMARIVHGSRIALSVGFVAVGIYVWIGVILGALAGYYGGWVDITISRLIEVMLSIPTFFLIISVVAFLEPSIYNVMAAIGLVGWTGTARLTRGEFLKLRNMQFVDATRALGARDPRVIFRHILPNALTPVLVVATFGVADAILIESSLSFLGFGVQPPTASWGDILSKARSYYDIAWWLTVFPGLAIFLTVTALNLVGEGFRDAVDPRLKDTR